MKQIKKLQLGLFLLLTIGFTSQAHALLSTSIKGGLGVNKIAITDVGGTDLSTAGYGIGYQGGIGLDFGLGPIAVGADVLFAQRGSFIGIASSKWNTILVPVQAKLTLIPFLSLGLGGYFSTAIGDISTDTGAGSTSSVSFAAANMSKSDFGAVASLGISLPLGVTTLSLEGRYLYGMKNLQTNATGDASMKLSAFDMLVGVTF